MPLLRAGFHAILDAGAYSASALVKMYEMGSSADNNSQPASPAPELEHSSQTKESGTRARKPRTQTKWPEDKFTAIGIDDEVWPVPQATRDRFVLVCGLIAQERVSINVKLESIPKETKEREFFLGIEEFLEYPGNLSSVDRQKAIRLAIKEIGILHRRFKSHLRKDFVRQELTPFQKHPFLKQEDWDQFVDITKSEDFVQKS
ncbi:hydroxyproline-rich glycoprotein-like [Panicum miliaceum]|uniref:Hydroxyproline-rich glycoprotein-like n=1 Tax=Panicum miliaceum TaxID=4540 RepID=A0A3L6SUF7_PANMI|nr:hydroxyproline-rich glycoprotein-like [Panicum miliaceum]